MLPICALAVNRGLLEPRFWTECAESQLKGNLYKTREMLIHAHLDGFNPSWKQGSLHSVTAKFRSDIIR